jgi:DNA-binding transcriptional LysR family regulator
MQTLRKGLVYFDQAIRDGSIRKAAESLHVASSAISRQLLQLEYELNVPLFHRLPRGIRPTAAGEAVLEYVRQSNNEAARLKHDIARLKGGMRGTIRIAAAESIIEEILPAVMQQFAEKYPLIDFSLISGDNHRIREELLAKDADIVCAFDVPEGVRGVSVARVDVDLGVIVPPGHPLTELAAVPLGTCARYPLITPTLEWLAHSSIRDLLDERNVQLRVASRVERISSLKKLVAAGMGIAFLSRVGLREDIANGRLVWLPLAPRTAKPAVISLLVEKGRVQPPYLSTFVDLMRQELEQLREQDPAGSPAFQPVTPPPLVVQNV